jgi:heme/copper-type cytochrome/quinol oxidase subunit 2
MDEQQFKTIRALLVVMLVILGFIAGLLLAFAWEYL